MASTIQEHFAGENQSLSCHTGAGVYDQSKIDASKKEIRLLMLHPGDACGTISCDLYVVSLVNDPVYSALSYTWGESSKKYWIWVNSAQFFVTKNLFKALLQIRAHNAAAPAVLWIDAVCIDQSNTEERNKQVELMGEIYSKCDRAIVWLGSFGQNPAERKCCALVGDESDFDQKWDDYLSCFEFEDEHRPSLETATSYACIDSTAIDTTQHMAWFIRLLADGQDYTSHPLVMFALELWESSSARKDTEAIDTAGRAKLIMSEWFTRLWVVQEAVLAPSMIILFGSASLPYEVLIKARDAVDKHPNPNSRAELQIIYLVWFLRALSPIQSLRDSRAAGEDIPLLPLRLRFNHCMASEDLDQIYALLGLASKELEIIPDYSASVEQVYTDFCGQYIRQSRSLLVLAFAGARFKYPDLPSWVIDWTVIETNRPGFRSSWLSIIPLFNTCGGLMQSGSVWSGNTLSVSGIEFDRINNTSEIMKTYQRYDLTKWADFCLMSGNPTVYPSECSFRDVFWRTICLDSSWTPTSTRRAGNKDICYLIQAVRSEQELEPQLPIVESDLVVTSESSESAIEEVDMLTTLSVLIHEHKLFITDNGYIGLGNGNAKVGDRVFILPGLQIPIILRPAGEGKPEIMGLSDVYTVVGESYVHGIMDGEVVKGSRWSIKDVVIQ